MKLLVLGATGMAGHMIAIYLLEQGHDVTSYSRRPFPYCKCVTEDIREVEKLTALLKKENYDAVINCIGILNDNCEQDITSTIFLNSLLPHFLVRELKDINNNKTKLIHLSTDCVFSGKIGNYDEYSKTDGETLYDRSKALGEVNDSINLTFRNSIIGPDMHPNGRGLFNWFIKQNGPVNGYINAIWTGVTTLTLAAAIEKALETDLKGLYHLVNNQPIDKYSLLQLLNQCFCDNRIMIYPYENIKINKSLVNTRNDFSFIVPTYEKMVEDMHKWVSDHKELYPHYRNVIR